MADPAESNGPHYAGPAQLRRLLGAVMSIGADVDLPVVLQRIVEAAQELIGARYVALGVLDRTHTYLEEFITSGIDESTKAVIGELPKGHGILGVLIDDPRPLRLPDLEEAPGRFGFPPGHPAMRSFLGVPLYVHGEVFGNLYFTEKLAGEVFTDIDEELAVALAAAAAVAIENARLHQRTQELSLIADRERVGHDLHDGVIQAVFSAGLDMHTTARLCADGEVRQRIMEHIDQLDQVVQLIRSTVFDLDTARADSLSVGRVVVHAGSAGRSLGLDAEVSCTGRLDAAISVSGGAEVVATVEDLLAAAARRSGASATTIGIHVGDDVVLTIAVDGDAPLDGRVIDEIRTRALGFGGDVDVDVRAAPEHGWIVRWRAPLAHLGR